MPPNAKHTSITPVREREAQAQNVIEIYIPDGRIIKFPAGTTVSVIEKAMKKAFSTTGAPKFDPAQPFQEIVDDPRLVEALRKADAAGNMDDARRLAAAIAAQRKQTELTAQQQTTVAPEQPRAELERLRKLKRLHVLEAKKSNPFDVFDQQKPNFDSPNVNIISNNPTHKRLIWSAIYSYVSLIFIPFFFLLFLGVLGAWVFMPNKKS